MKTKKIRIRQGFTIVELVIVIGVIGVLSAVLIPTFINLNNKANRASDESLVKNLNTALAMKEQDPKDIKNATMHDAVEDLKEYGYLLPNLVTKSEDKLLWNQKTNRFILESDDKGDQKPIEFWRIQDSVKGDEVYSVYAGLNFEGAGENKDAVTVKVGFDIGDNKGIKLVSYVRPDSASQEVIIRTVSGSLTINAPEDSVKHYGELETLAITAVKGASYHEHGKVRGKAIISSGHLEIEEGGEVPQVLVKNATGPVTVTANEPTIVIADSASESQTSVVANSTEVYVSGVSAGNVSGSESSSVVRAQDVTDNATLKAGLAAGGFYRVANAFEVSVAVETPVGKTAVIDFNGKVVTADNWKWANYGTLTVTDSGENGGISCGKGCLDNYGKLIVDGGTYTTTVLDGGAAIWNNPDANLIINDCKIEAGRVAVVNHSIATINGGRFNSISTSANGAGMYAYCIISEKEDGSSCPVEITFNGGTVTGIHGAISISSGKGVINNVNASTKEGDQYAFYALYVAGEEGEVSATVNGGTFVGGYRSALHIGNKTDGGIGALAIIAINDGKFIAPSGKEAIMVSTGDGYYGIGYAYIYGGTFSTKPADTYIGAGLSAVQNSDGTYTVK